MAELVTLDEWIPTEPIKRIFTGVAGGALLMGSGVILSMTTGFIEHKTLKLIPQIGALGLGLYGGYVVYDAVINPTENAKPTDAFPMTLSHPTGADRVIQQISFDFGGIISNQYSVGKRVYAGMTLNKVGTENYYNYSVKEVVIGKNSTQEVLWKGTVRGAQQESWRIRCSVWDMPPRLGAPATRLGDTDWITFTVLGV